MDRHSQRYKMYILLEYHNLEKKIPLVELAKDFHIFTLQNNSSNNRAKFKIYQNEKMLDILTQWVNI